MVVLNSRYQPKNTWLPKRMHLDKQQYKNQNTKYQPHCYNYSYLHSNKQNAATFVH